MTPQERIAYWDSKPEIALQNEFGVLDRRVLIKHVAELIEGPYTLEIGVNQGHVLAYCHESFGEYVGVDIDLSNIEQTNGFSCPVIYVETDSASFWRGLLDNRYDLIFVDGDHHTHEAYVDTTQAMLRLAPNGYILAHDVNPPAELNEPELYDHGPTFAHNRIKNLPGWYARILEGHPEGLAIYFRTA